MARNMLWRWRDYRFFVAGGELDAGETDSNKTYRLHFLLHYGLQPKDCVIIDPSPAGPHIPSQRR